MDICFITLLFFYLFLFFVLFFLSLFFALWACNHTVAYQRNPPHQRPNTHEIYQGRWNCPSSLRVLGTRRRGTPLRSRIGSCLDGPFRPFVFSPSCATRLITHSFTTPTTSLHRISRIHTTSRPPLFHRLYPTHTLSLLLQRHVRLLIQCFSFFFGWIVATEYSSQAFTPRGTLFLWGLGYV